MKALQKIRGWFGGQRHQGPFGCLVCTQVKTPYHRRAMDGRFKEALAAYLERELLPQVEEPYEAIEGTISPEYNDQKYCGPHSAVKDIYRLQVAFIREGSKDEVVTQLCRDTTTGSFRPRHRRQPLVLWTRKKKEALATFRTAIQAIVEDIKSGKKANLTCPRCNAPLELIDRPDLFDLNCRTGCFNYNFHRDPTTGGFLHGHFFTDQNKTEEPNKPSDATSEPAPGADSSSHQR